MQPDGLWLLIVLLRVPSTHLPGSYSKEVQIKGGGTQDWLKAGVPPVQPDGNRPVTVRLCEPLAQILHPLYVNEVQEPPDSGGTTGSTVTVTSSATDKLPSVAVKRRT